MKNIFLIALLFMSICNIYLQPKIDWQKSYGGSNDDYPYFASSDIITSDGGYFIGGITASSNGNVTGFHGVQDFWALRLNSSGNLQWQKAYGGSNDDYATAWIQTSDNGFLIVGATNSDDGNVSGNHGGYDIWVTKLNSLGTLLWSKCYGGSDYDFGYCVANTSDGGYIIAGKTWSSDGNVTGYHGNGDAWVLKISASGSLLWQKTLGGSGEENIWNIKQSGTGFIVAGTTNSKDGNLTNNKGNFDVWIFRLNSTGTVEWSKNFGGSQNDYAYSCYPISDGSFIVAGETQSNNGDISGNKGGFDIWILKINSQGNIQWQKTLGGTEDDWACSIRPLNDGGFVIGGSSKSNNGDFSGNHGDWDYLILKINSAGILQWQELIGSTGDDEATIVQQTSDGGYIACGYASASNGNVSSNAGKSDIWIVKLNSTSSPSVELYDNELFLFPNPACQKLYLNINDSFLDSQSKYQIFNSNSILVGEGKITTATNQQIGIEGLIPGIYFLKIETRNNQTGRKFIVN